MDGSVQTDRWQFQGTAEAYEQYLAPLLSQWTDDLLAAAALRPGERVLDLACGTGAVARRVAELVGPAGQVAGLDADAGMLRVARSLDDPGSSAIDWREGMAEEMPFPDGAFDAVLCQQGLQFFTSRPAALQEMRRVLAPGGRLVASLWRPLAYSPGYAALAGALERHVGPEAAAMMRAPFALGDLALLRGELAGAGFQDVHARSAFRAARFPSPEEMLRRELVSWLAGVTGELDEATRSAIIAEITAELAPYLDDEGLIFPMEAWILSARVGQEGEPPKAASTQWQLANDAAERYQQVLVPAILGPFARALADWAGLRAGEVVLDVGCGTGAAALRAAEYTGPAGRVTGVDVNPAMLEVARRLPAPPACPIDWKEAGAERLPQADASVDVVVCAQTLQFLPDRPAALAEMRRALKPGGRAVVSLWSDIRDNPYFDALVAAITRHIGPETARGLGVAFALTGPDEIRRLLTEAGFTRVAVDPVIIPLDLPPVQDFVPRHIQATPMGAGYGAAFPAARQAVLAEIAERLQPFTRPDGSLRAPFQSYFALGFRPGG